MLATNTLDCLKCMFYSISELISFINALKKSKMNSLEKVEVLLLSNSHKEMQAEAEVVLKDNE